MTDVKARIIELETRFATIKETLEKDISGLEELSADESLASDLEKEAAGVEKELEKLELVTYLSGQYDDKNAVVGIHAGQGGTEAMDWAAMLLRMYLRFCERWGFKT